MKGNKHGLSNIISDLFVVAIWIVLLCLVSAVCIFGIAAIDQRVEETTISEML